MNEQGGCSHTHEITSDTTPSTVSYHNLSEPLDEKFRKRVYFLPTECGVPEKLHNDWGLNGDRPYVIGAPMAVLDDTDTAAKVFRDIADIAHARLIQIILPEGVEYSQERVFSRVRTLCERLCLDRDFSTEVKTLSSGDGGDISRESDDHLRTMLATLCVDKRLTSCLPSRLKAADEEDERRMKRVGLPRVPVQYARIRHPASFLFWHPEALKLLSPEHQNYCQRTIDTLRDHPDWKINTLINHFATNGEAGCGGVAFLRSKGMNIVDATHEIELFREIRDKYHYLMTPNAQIKFDVVSVDKGQTVVERIPLDEFDYGSDGKLVGNELITI